MKYSVGKYQPTKSSHWLATGKGGYLVNHSPLTGNKLHRTFTCVRYTVPRPLRLNRYIRDICEKRVCILHGHGSFPHNLGLQARLPMGELIDTLPKRF